MRAREAFQKAFHGQPNFMTPRVVWCHKVGRYAVELSQGSGIEPGTMIYGVTVLDATTAERELDLDQMFYDFDQARAYAEGLNEDA